MPEEIQNNRLEPKVKRAPEEHSFPIEQPSRSVSPPRPKALVKQTVPPKVTERTYIPTGLRKEETTNKKRRFQEFRGESIPPGLHIYGATLGNDKHKVKKEFQRVGNQDRLIYLAVNGLTLTAVLDEGQGVDSVDALVGLLTNQEFLSALQSDRGQE